MLPFDCKHDHVEASPWASISKPGMTYKCLDCYRMWHEDGTELPPAIKVSAEDLRQNLKAFLDGE